MFSVEFQALVVGFNFGLAGQKRQGEKDGVQGGGQQWGRMQHGVRAYKSKGVALFSTFNLGESGGAGIAIEWCALVVAPSTSKKPLLVAPPSIDEIGQVKNVLFNPILHFGHFCPSLPHVFDLPQCQQPWRQGELPGNEEQKKTRKQENNKEHWRDKQSCPSKAGNVFKGWRRFHKNTAYARSGV